MVGLRLVREMLPDTSHNVGKLFHRPYFSSINSKSKYLERLRPCKQTDVSTYNMESLLPRKSKLFQHYNLKLNSIELTAWLRFENIDYCLKYEKVRRCTFT